jgi:glycosyltransferase involved in cell wall biosynthesis
MTPGRKLRVMLALPDLRDLGVQHDVRYLMKYWNRDRFEPIMLLHRREGEFADQFTADMASIEVDKLVWSPPRARVVLRVLGYVRAFRQFAPDAVISFVPYSNLASVYARPLSGRRFGLAVSEHAHVTASLQDREAFAAPFLWFYRRRFSELYRRADLVKCIAEESRRDLIENHGVPESRTRLIYNPVDFDEVRMFAKEAPDHSWFGAEELRRIPLFINVGRLIAQKRQDLLLRAFANLHAKRRCRLALVGRGNHLAQLERLAAELGVSHDVVFLGFQRNPWKYMGRATALVVSSDWEGLPCVLTEAMCLGVPIVSTRCPSGPAEMLLEGRGGILCPTGDVGALSAGMGSVLDDSTLARKRADAAHAALARFEPANVTKQYESLAAELATRSHEAFRPIAVGSA